MDPYIGVTWTEYQQSIEAARTYLAGSMAGRRALAAEAKEMLPAKQPKVGKVQAVSGNLFGTETDDS